MGSKARPSLRLTTTLLRSHKVGTVACHFRHGGDVTEDGCRDDGNAADPRDEDDDENTDDIDLEDRPAKPTPWPISIVIWHD